jgi:hypothetical protein
MNGPDGGTGVIEARNWWRVVSVIPAELVAEFLDGPAVGVIEVEPL